MPNNNRTRVLTPHFSASGNNGGYNASAGVTIPRALPGNGSLTVGGTVSGGWGGRPSFGGQVSAGWKF